MIVNFNDEIVLVTGSSRGIGLSIAYHFAKAGATVILNGAHNKEALDQATSSFK